MSIVLPAVFTASPFCMFPSVNNTPASAAGNTVTTVTHITEKGCLEEHTGPLSTFIYDFPLRFGAGTYMKLASQLWI